MAEKVKKCLIISGSPSDGIEFIKPRINSFDCVICADSGFEKAKALGIVPDIIVGDFDSYSGALNSCSEIVRLNTHKDDSDTQHCVSLAVEKGYEHITVIGALGGRTDHLLANISLLKFAFDSGVSAVIESEAEIIHYISGCGIELNGFSGHTFSVLPVFCDSVTVSYEGEVEYPADKLEIKASQASLGLSDIAKSDRMYIRAESGNAVVMIQKRL